MLRFPDRTKDESLMRCVEQEERLPITLQSPAVGQTTDRPLCRRFTPGNSAARMATTAMSLRCDTSGTGFAAGDRCGYWGTPRPQGPGLRWLPRYLDIWALNVMGMAHSSPTRFRYSSGWKTPADPRGESRGEECGRSRSAKTKSRTVLVWASGVSRVRQCRIQHCPSSRARLSSVLWRVQIAEAVCMIVKTRQTLATRATSARMWRKSARSGSA